MDERIIDYFVKHEDEMLGDISELVAVDSAKGPELPGAPYGAGARRVLDVAKQMAEKYGFSAEIRGDRVCVVEMGEGEPELGMLAHLDVVPAAGGWTVTEPFVMKRDGDIIYGRGVGDDKGPAVAALYAMRCLKELGIPLNKRVQLILGSDEENGSSDIAWYLQNYKMPPKVFTPDGSFPLVNSEKGKLDMTLSAPYADGEIVSIKGGSVANAVPGVCTAVLKGVSLDAVSAAAKTVSAEFEAAANGDNVTLTCNGKASHASVPENGINAIAATLCALANMELADTAVFRAVKAMAKALPFGDNEGAAFGGACADEETGRLTVNLGVISYDEAGLTAKVDCRVPVCGDGMEIAAALETALGGDVAVKVTNLLKPHNTPKESEFVKGLLEVYNDYTGDHGEAFSIGGLTYVHEVEGGVAFGCSFPEFEEHAHEPDERMHIGHLLKSGEIFAASIERFCGYAKS